MCSFGYGTVCEEVIIIRSYSLPAHSKQTRHIIRFTGQDEMRNKKKQMFVLQGESVQEANCYQQQTVPSNSYFI
jgi:hypothetical protein